MPRVLWKDFREALAKQMLSDGKTSAQVASRCHISDYAVSTITTHLSTGGISVCAFLSICEYMNVDPRNFFQADEPRQSGRYMSETDERSAG